MKIDNYQKVTNLLLNFKFFTFLLYYTPLAKKLQELSKFFSLHFFNKNVTFLLQTF